MFEKSLSLSPSLALKLSFFFKKLFLSGVKDGKETKRKEQAGENHI